VNKTEQIEMFTKPPKEAHRYECEWIGMPEFVMNPEIPIKTIKLSFKTLEAIEKFSELIGQEVRTSQENYWYPKLNRCSFSQEKYYNES
tara:strand:+ start:1278 stop:1544 length:267 start_codon:yes stop_codon:yes gene_type:complete